MLILALETSSLAGSIALLYGDRLLATRQLPADRRSAQSLAPAIDAMLKSAGRLPRDVQLVAVTVGPGSFTGLRVGVTTAKTFAYAAGCEVLGVDTLDVIARQTDAAEAREIHAVLDAQRKELYIARFRISGDNLTRLEPNRVIAAGAWLESLQPGTIVSGPGVARLVDRLPAGVVASLSDHRDPQATTVSRLAYRQHQMGRRDDLWTLAPQYLRPSAAEERTGQVSNLP